MKALHFLAIAVLSVVVCQAQPSFTPQRFGPPPGLPSVSSPLADTNPPANYVIKVLMKDAKGNASSLQVTTIAGSFELDTLQKNSVKINNTDIPTTLKLSGELTKINEQKGRLKLFLGRTVPYVTSSFNNGASSSYSQLSVGLDSAFVVTFGKPLLVQVDDNGEVSVLVTREED
jgi:hypothetical protein